MRIIFQRSTQSQFTTIFTLWQDTVKATHSFLSPSDFNAIEQEVYYFLSKTPVTIAVNEHNMITGFMLLNHAHLEALFIHPDFHNLGIGRKMINQALQKHPILTTTVNEQNIQAVGFYRHLGFQQTHRSETDQQNRPYPLLYLKYTSPKGPQS